MKRTLSVLGCFVLAFTSGCTTNNYYGWSGDPDSGGPTRPASRALKGSLAKASSKLQTTHVAAIELTKKGQKARTVRAAVGTDGAFELQLPTGTRWMVVAQSAHKATAVLSVPTSKSGKATSALSWSGASNEESNDAIDMGTLAFRGGSMEAENNPLTILDFDDDGTNDFDDDDDDNDGTSDDDDDDDDNDGAPDNEEDGDTDDDGDVDLIDDDDDDDGTPDSADDDDDGDGVLDATDKDSDDDGIADEEDDDDDNDGIPDDEDDDDDGDGSPDADEPHDKDDFDGDGVPNSTDNDDDNDGIPDAEDPDDDNDGTPDDQDLDDDNDGVPDLQEVGP